MRGLLMTLIAVDFPGLSAGRDCVRANSTNATKTTTKTV